MYCEEVELNGGEVMMNDSETAASVEVASAW